MGNLQKQWLQQKPIYFPEYISPYFQNKKDSTVMIYETKVSINNNLEFLIITPLKAHFPQEENIFGLKTTFSLSYRRIIQYSNFETLYKFTYFLMADLYKLQTRENIQKNQRAIETFLNGNNENNFNLLIGMYKNQKVDYEEMLKFIMFKEDDSYCKSLPPLKLENLYNKIVIPLKKPFLNLCCYHLFEDIKKEKAIKLFEILVQVGAFTDLEYALQYYQVDTDLIQSQTLYEYLHDPNQIKIDQNKEKQDDQNNEKQSKKNKRNTNEKINLQSIRTKYLF